MDRVRKQIYCNDIVISNRQPCTIAFLDTGINGKHPDLKDRIVYFKDFIHQRSIPYDDSGHGTHVCGIAVGNGSCSKGKYKGISPNSNIIMLKILDMNGDGSFQHLIEALQWIIKNKDPFSIRIINVSIELSKIENIDIQNQINGLIEEAWDNNLVINCAAGNMGPKDNTISEFGKSNKILTIGCHDGDFCIDNENKCERCSGRGEQNNFIKKPDLVAPGTDIVSCNHNYNIDYYCKKSGTSMSTPIVSGAVALMIENNPELSNELIKKSLLFSATDLYEPWTKQGWGLINVKSALKLSQKLY